MGQSRSQSSGACLWWVRLYLGSLKCRSKSSFSCKAAEPYFLFPRSFYPSDRITLVSSFITLVRRFTGKLRAAEVGSSRMFKPLSSHSSISSYYAAIFLYQYPIQRLNLHPPVYFQSPILAIFLSPICLHLPTLGPPPMSPPAP